ncbi:hypothetical protein [Streptomyces sp. NPDC048282]|uniref:hypothetical protein n=1 Tax=Streptomyces sp. NPDC048282 TaxID=3365528 RepID=UPI0037165B87
MQVPRRTSGEGTASHPSQPPGGDPHRPQEARTAEATIDARGVVTGWSDGAALLPGCPPAEILGHRAALPLAEPDQDAWRAAAAGTPWSGTAALRHREGAPAGPGRPGPPQALRRAARRRRAAGGVRRDRPGAAASGRALGAWAFDGSRCVRAGPAPAPGARCRRPRGRCGGCG